MPEVALSRAIRCAVNLLYFRPGGVGGSETYVRELLPRLGGDGLEVVVYAWTGAATALADLGVEIVPLLSGPYSQIRRLRAENLSLARALDARPADILFSPANIGAPFLPRSLPQVMTVHDLQHRWFPSYFAPATRLGRDALMAASIARCRKVIAISEFTRGDLRTRLRVPDRKLVTILEGGPDLGAPAPDSSAVLRYGLSSPYLIYPATAAPHKNHATLFAALERLATRREVPDLVLTGCEPDRFDGTPHVRALGRLPRAELLGLIQGAFALVFPSRFEGFGLPLVEAMGLGTPLIASTAASIPEIVGDAGLLVAPDDAGGFAAAIARLLDEPALRAVLVARGLERARHFDWQETARRTRELLIEAATS